jgi:PBP1b-binding outer membrane lipoprotein LpoB
MKAITLALFMVACVATVAPVQPSAPQPQHLCQTASGNVNACPPPK